MPRRSCRPSLPPHPPRCSREARSSQRLSVALLALFLSIGLTACKTGNSSRANGNEPPTPTATPNFELVDRTAPVLPDRPLLIALRWTGEPGTAPTTVDARTDAGRTVPLPVRRLGARLKPARTDATLRFGQWRWSATATEIFEIDPASEAAATAYLLVLKDPNTWPGVGLNVGSGRIMLVPVTPDPNEPSSDPLAPSGGFDEPNPTSPLEAMRRGLWRRHVNPNALATEEDRDSTLSMLGRQTAGRWFAALAALTLIDPALSLDLQRLLVRTAWDGSERFAAWPAWSADLAELETILLSRLTEAPGDEDWRLRVKAWVSRQPDAVPWIESDTGLEVRLPCANLTTSSQRARMSYANRPQDVSTMNLAPASVGRATLDRPAESPPDRIIVQTSSTNRALALLEPQTIVLPPGLGLEVLWQSWTLDTWLAGQPAPADPQRSASILVRRSPDTQRWELVITCNLAEPLPGAIPGAPRPLDVVADWSELVGHESVTVLVGPFGNPIIAATILPDGSTRDWQRSGLLSPANIAVKTEPGRWQITMTLPDALTADLHPELGLVRMNEGRDEVDCFPRPALPWRHDPGRLQLDLSRWDALPTPQLPPPSSPPGGGE